MSRNSNKRQNWNPYISSIQKYSIYPSIKTMEEKNLKVGDIITIDIYDVDEKGNGVVSYGDKKIVVPNATSGSKVKVKIIKLQGDVAFGHVIKVLSESNTGY
ncbi:MAG: TRAM domain-containing protein [Desulfurococcaceae archaeon]